MKDKNLKIIYAHIFDFMGLFHQKFGPSFRRHDDGDYKCNKNQNKAIMIISDKGKITPTLLGKYLDMRKGSLTTLIDSLEDAGLVYRSIDQADRRKTWVHLTEDGEKYVVIKKQEFENKIISLFNKLPEEEIQEFADSIKTVVNIMKRI